MHLSVFSHTVHVHLSSCPRACVEKQARSGSYSNICKHLHIPLCFPWSCLLCALCLVYSVSPCIYLMLSESLLPDSCGVELDGDWTLWRHLVLLFIICRVCRQTVRNEHFRKSYTKFKNTTGYVIPLGDLCVCIRPMCVCVCVCVCVGGCVCVCVWVCVPALRLNWPDHKSGGKRLDLIFPLLFSQERDVIVKAL